MPKRPVPSCGRSPRPSRRLKIYKSTAVRSALLLLMTEGDGSSEGEKNVGHVGSGVGGKRK